MAEGKSHCDRNTLNYLNREQTKDYYQLKLLC